MFNFFALAGRSLDNDRELAGAFQQISDELRSQYSIGYSPTNSVHDVSYRKLDAAAGALARQLRELGVGPEVRVGVCLPRSVDLIVAVLAVAKAGGAFVPVDAAVPAERAAFMLADAGVAVVLTTAGWRGRVPEGTLQVTVGGQDTSVDLTQEQTTEVATSDTSYTAKK